MPDYRTPGVYIEEQLATGPIAGVGTSTAAFLGVTGRGPVGEPVKVTNMTGFAERFVPNGRLAEPYLNLVGGVRGFFENGGTVAYVLRLPSGGTHASVQLNGGEPAKPVLELTARDAGQRGQDIEVTVPSVDAAGRFTLELHGPELDTAGKKVVRTFGSLSIDPRDPSFVGTTLAGSPVTARVLDPATPPSKLEQPAALAGGTDDVAGDVGKPSDWDAALAALGRVDEVSMVAAPGITAAALQQKLIAHCERTQDRFALLDAEAGATPASVANQRGKVPSARGYAALYHPWLRVADPDARGGETLLVPPSGHVAGVFARVDAERGVHKAPANELITGALGLEAVLDDTEHGDLNVAGVNCLRIFAGRSRPVVWGARTTSDDTAWRYVNVRRLFLFVEESIQEGIRWAVFEPNDRALWKRLNRTITEFLTRVWSSGALFGATAAEAFYVKIDDENNPSPDLGQVFIEVGIAPVRPAEFVVVRIGIWAGGGQVQEG